jgi:hypothetical protein
MGTVLRKSLLTVEGLNRAAAGLGEGLLPFTADYGFPVKYGCLLWIVYLGEYKEITDKNVGPKITWKTDKKVQPLGVVTVNNWKECHRYLALEDGDPVADTVESSSPVPTKVYLWNTATDAAGLEEFYAKRVPELRTLVLHQGWRIKRNVRKNWPPTPGETEFWPETSPPLQVVTEKNKPFSVLASARCKVCEQPLAGEVRKFQQGYRHAECFPHLTLVYQGGHEVTAPYISPKTPCPVCGKPLHEPPGGKVYRQGRTYRHADCSIQIRLGEGNHRVMVAADTNCAVCKQPIGGVAHIYQGGYRHPNCAPEKRRPRAGHIRVTYHGAETLFPDHATCQICGKKLSGKVYTYEEGYRHESCPVPPAITLDKQGRAIYRHGGYRREDGVWVCPTKAARYGMPFHTTWPYGGSHSGNSWVRRKPMLDEWSDPERFGRSAPGYK